jgi:tetratricopeptide (TPR) repeat protein
MERSDQKVDYLKAIVDAEKQVSPAVRSMAALRLTAVYSERMQNERAVDALGTALKLNPLNVEALKVRYTHAPPANPYERLQLLLTMLLANPAQPEVAGSVARELGNAGMVTRSIDWFNQAVDLHKRMGVQPTNEFGVDFASELFISGDPAGAKIVADTLTAKTPDDLNAWLMRLILAKNAGEKGKAEFDTVVRQANVALANRLAMIAKAAGDTTATTRPVETTDVVELPDPRALAQRVVATRDPQLIGQFLPVAGGVAWLRIYFQQQPAQAIPWIETLAAMTEGGPADAAVARLQGWSYLVAGNKDEARV